MNIEFLDNMLEFERKLKMLKRGGSLLGRDPPEVIATAQDDSYNMYIEYTLTYPYTKKWSQMLSIQQKKFYNGAVEKLKGFCTLWLIESGHVYEFHKSGHVHCHGYMRLKMKEMFSPIGLISDLCKVYYSLLPKNVYYTEKCMFPKYNRYKSAPICMTIYNEDEPYEIDGNEYSVSDRKAKWLEYMTKTGVQII